MPIKQVKQVIAQFTNLFVCVLKEFGIVENYTQRKGG